MHEAIAEWIAVYFDNAMTKFIVNNRTDALKTDIKLFSNFLLSLADALHEFQICVCLHIDNKN